MRPKVGVMLPLGSGDARRVMDVAREAEDLGFDGVFGFDHFYAPGSSPDHPALEAITTLAAVGAITQRIALGTLVLRVGVRAPGMLAKMSAQLDDQTDGRFILGLGAGDEAGRAELATYGIPDVATQEERWVLLQETLGTLRALFDGQVWPGGELVPHIAGPLRPAPARSGGPPIWLGGMSHAARRLAATAADGWNAWGVPEEVFLERAASVQAEATQAGRACRTSWAGVAMVGKDEEEVQELLTRRRERGMSDDGLWAGTAQGFAAFCDRLGAGGAEWVIVAPAGLGTKLTTIAEGFKW